MSGAPGPFELPGLPARRAASWALDGVLERRRTLADLAADPDGPFSGLPPQDRARAQTLATRVLRNLQGLDWLLESYLRKTPPPGVMNILRIAACEMLLDGIPPHAAVSAAVEQVGALRRHGHMKGMANGVLRNVARDGAARWAERPDPALPGWLKARLAKAWGREAAEAVARALTAQPPLDLTPKDAAKDPAKAAAIAAAAGGEVLPTGSVRLMRMAQVSALPGFEAGDWWVQDAAAALPVRMLGDVSGQAVVDLCAAPGGKTMQLAAAGAAVTAVDLSAERLRRLKANLARTGLAAEVVAADALDWAPAGPVDAVVLDAPCSATGTLRRHPDLPFARPDPDLKPLLELQAALIDRAVGWLRPGGRLLYCTCSLFPAEGEAQVHAALERHPELRRGGTRPAGVPDEAWTPDGALRTRPDFWPERGGMDGFYAAVLTRRA